MSNGRGKNMDLQIAYITKSNIYRTPKSTFWVPSPAFPLTRGVRGVLRPDRTIPQAVVSAMIAPDPPGADNPNTPIYIKDISTVIQFEVAALDAIEGSGLDFYEIGIMQTQERLPSITEAIALNA